MTEANQEGKINTLQEALETIASWARRGTQQQFANEMRANLIADEEYRVDTTGNTVVFVEVRQEGGFLGIGGEAVTESLLQVQFQDDGQVVIPSEPMDKEFAIDLAERLERH
jgi:hypothetical protein